MCPWARNCTPLYHCVNVGVNGYLLMSRCTLYCSLHYDSMNVCEKGWMVACVVRFLYKCSPFAIYFDTGGLLTTADTLKLEHIWCQVNKIQFCGSCWNMHTSSNLHTVFQLMILTTLFQGLIQTPMVLLRTEIKAYPLMDLPWCKAKEICQANRSMPFLKLSKQGQKNNKIK